MTNWFVGIDPGLVHTGVVAFGFDTEGHHLTVIPTVIDGTQELEVKRVIDGTPEGPVFIEAYRPRSHFGTDEKMVQFVGQLRKTLPGSKIINNTGVKKIISRKLMEAMDVWKFTQSTHHQDLRSAARIGLYGALKDKELNAIVYNYMTDFVDGSPWKIN